MKAIKRCKIFEWDRPNTWWQSHTMAPTAVMWQGNIRVFFGAWDRFGISRMNYLDLAADDPSSILFVNTEEPVLDIGQPGTFDDNGVFPGHAAVVNDQIYLYYTGFQKGDKIPHFTFGGLATSVDGSTFQRVSQAPILDRSDEGLLVRSGQSILFEDGVYKSVYSVGNHFVDVGGKARPSYDVCYLESRDGIDFGRTGRVIVHHDPSIEHGLGRPQLIRLDGKLFVFYTRRMLDMKYFMGCAISDDEGLTWVKNESLFSEMCHPEAGFDSEMIYFPSVLTVPESGKTYLFYSGNGFGKTGIGYAELMGSADE